MRKLFALCVMMLMCAVMMAQAPQKMTYQAVVRGSNNALVTNQNVSVRLSILQGTPTGSAIYVETHNVTTNDNGLLTVEVGGGNSNHNFSQIPWAQGVFYLKSEIDPNGGVNYTVESVQQLLSVPYALYATNAGNVPAFVMTPTDTGYVLDCTMPDGTTQSYVIRNGQQGPQGPAGPAGTNGTNGRGIQSITGPMSSGLDDTYTINFTDYTSFTFVVHNGAPGAQGPAGPAGPAGTNGTNGTNGADGQDGQDGFSPVVNTVTAGDSTVVTITDATGPHTFVVHNGEQGPVGATGPQGPAGPAGAAGATGPQGPAGPAGATGATGPQGEQGPAGPAGPAGANGANGQDGQDGFSPVVNTVTAGDSTVVTITDHNGPHTFVVHNGEQGPQGPAGPAGTNGTNGLNGQDGRGIQSVTGPVSAGNVDTYTIHYTDNTTSTFTVTNGLDGTAAAAGVGIQSIIKTGTSGLVDTYTITYTDGTTSTYEVANGAPGANGSNGANGQDGQDGFSPVVNTVTAGDSTVVTITDASGLHTFVVRNGEQGPVGATGPQGPAGPAGPAGTNGTNGQDGRGIQSITGPVSNGLVDTYTINFTDGTTYTFDVTNGTNGGGIAQVNADWNATSGVAEILNKPAIPDVSGLQHQIDSLQNVLGTIAQNTFVCGVSKAKDYDGNEYSTLKLGDQCWMKENLRAIHYSDGTAIPTSSSISSTLPYRYYPGNDSANVPVYGLLYNWTAVMNGATSSNTNPSKVQGVCPTGWHVPSEAEWNQLNVFVSSQSEYVCGDTNVNIAKAMCAATGWVSSVTDCAPGNNQDLNNATDFSVYAAGYYRGSAVYNVGYLAALWLSTKEGTEPKCGFWNFTTSYSWIASYQGYTGLSVRCIQDPILSDSQIRSINEELENLQQVLDNLTVPDFACGISKVNDYDGNRYGTVKLGTQCWMKENLKTTHYSDGTLIALSTDTSSVIPYRYNPGNSSFRVGTYGYLYNWRAVVRNEVGNTGHIQGVCPEGWHMPKQSEWDQLIAFVRSNDEYLCNGSSDKYLKAMAATTGWSTSSVECSPGNDMSSNNATGFGMLPGGKVSRTGNISSVGTSGAYWTLAENGNVYRWPMFFNSGGLSVNFGGGYDVSYYITEGMSVRCLRDEAESSADLSPLQILLWQLQQQINDLQNTQGELEVKLFNCGEQMKDVDGNLYNTIRMGTQCWMAENLRTTRYSDGTEIALSTDTSSSVAYRYSHSENTPPSKFGFAYNWQAIMHGETSSSANPSGVQGICPTGWHVPSMAEWRQLSDYVSSRSEYVCGDNANFIAKALASTTGWLSSSNVCATGNNPSANNATGFNIVSAPWFSNNSYSQMNYTTALASCSMIGERNYDFKQITSSSAIFATGSPTLSSASYVRCVFDRPVDTVSASPLLPQGATQGDMLYWNGTDWQVLPAGQQGQQLVMDGGTPTWQTPVDNSLHYILFNANGGSGTMNAQFFPNGVQQTVSANTFTRSGFIFTGWNTAADGTGTSYAPDAVLTLTGNITLYAQWTTRVTVPAPVPCGDTNQRGGTNARP